VLVSGVDAKVITVATQVGLELGLRMAKPLHKPLRVHELRDHLAAFLVGSLEIAPALLRRALEVGEIGLFYQPLIDLRCSRLIGWEALARWRQPQLGLIGPDRFVRLAEAEGLMGALTERVLTLAVEDLATWRRSKGRLAESFVSVNFSATDVRDAQFPDRLERLCLKHGVPAGQLRLELTETAAMGDTVRFVEVLTRLRVKGFQLAIDDFGTGYSSLVQLHRLPFSELKIDKTFVQGMATSEEAAIIVAAIISLAHSLHLELVAEGIETAIVADLLCEAGCEVGQGYYFARPMPPQEVAGWCAANPHYLEP